AARAESLSLTRKGSSALRRSCIWTFTAATYSCQALSVSDLSLTVLAIPGGTKIVSRLAQRATVRNESHLECPAVVRSRCPFGLIATHSSVARKSFRLPLFSFHMLHPSLNLLSA